MIVMIGDASVGKTSLLKKFQFGEEHNIDECKEQTTVGVEFISKDMRIFNNTVKLQVWDTAGQERFRSITAQYYRGAMGGIIVYDCTDPESFDHAEKWIQDYRASARENSPIVLLANKADASPMVSTERGQELANRYGASFLETSASSGQNVQRAFELICEQILLQRFPNAAKEAKEKEASIKLKETQTAAKGEQAQKGCCK